VAAITVSVIATATNAVSATISVGNGPLGVAVKSDGSKVYVANQFDNTVSVIATASNTVVATIDVGTYPIAFGIFILPR
jgi:YVTN family beta-propeller protein